MPEEDVRRLQPLPASQALFDLEAHDSLLRLRALTSRGDEGAAEVTTALAELHTLKGSAGLLGYERLAEAAHQLEAVIQHQQRLAPDWDARTRWLEACLIDDGVDSAQRFSTAEHPEPSAGTAHDRHALAAEDSGAAPDPDLQSLLTSSAAALRRLDSQVREHLSGGIVASRLLSDIEALRGLNEAASQRLMSAGRQPLAALRERLERTLAAAAAAQGRDVVLSLRQCAGTVSQARFRCLATALDHLARNAVAHGIEPSGIRKDRGKPPTGLVTLQAVFDASGLVVSLTDDGAGIQPESADAGVSPSQPVVLSRRDIDRLTRSGFTTRPYADQLAGRGLGLSVVRQLIEREGGRVSVTSATGQGTTVHLHLPPAPSQPQTVLVVSLQAQWLAIPTSHVVEVSREPGTDSSKVPGYRVFIQSGDSRQPLDVDDLLGLRQLIFDPQTASSELIDGAEVRLLEGESLTEKLDMA